MIQIFEQIYKRKGTQARARRKFVYKRITQIFYKKQLYIKNSTGILQKIKKHASTGIYVK